MSNALAKGSSSSFLSTGTSSPSFAKSGYPYDYNEEYKQLPALPTSVARRMKQSRVLFADADNDDLADEDLEILGAKLTSCAGRPQQPSTSASKAQSTATSSKSTGRHATSPSRATAQANITASISSATVQTALATTPSLLQTLLRSSTGTPGADSQADASSAAATTTATAREVLVDYESVSTLCSLLEACRAVNEQERAEEEQQRQQQLRLHREAEARENRRLLLEWGRAVWVAVWRWMRMALLLLLGALLSVVIAQREELLEIAKDAMQQAGEMGQLVRGRVYGLAGEVVEGVTMEAAQQQFANMMQGSQGA